MAAVLAAAMIAGIFATPMAVYADEEHGYDGDGDSSETSTEQELKQKNVGSGASTNTNCGSNSINSAIAFTLCPGAEIEIGDD